MQVTRSISILTTSLLLLSTAPIFAESPDQTPSVINPSQSVLSAIEADIHYITNELQQTNYLLNKELQFLIQDHAVPKTIMLKKEIKKVPFIPNIDQSSCVESFIEVGEIEEQILDPDGSPSNLIKTTKTEIEKWNNGLPQLKKTITYKAQRKPPK